MMVAGANEGMKQNGNSVSTSTPRLPVSIDFFVNQNARKEVIRISARPNEFQRKAAFLESLFFFKSRLETQMLVKATVISPIPAESANKEGTFP